MSLIEQLESRTLLSATLVRLNTTLGNIDVRLTDDVTPITVANFLDYVNSGKYTNTIIHRNSGNVIQSGGYTYPGFAEVPKAAPIVNEFQSGITTNIRGTIGMAKTSDPDSATSEFFFNLVDNSSSFDNPFNSGGFTTFGTITSDTLATMDTIAAVPVSHNFSSPFDEFPLQNYAGGGIAFSNLILVRTATVLGEFTNTVNFGTGGARTVTFTDADGTLSTLSLAGGTGEITFGGSDVFVSTSRGRSIVTGTNLSLSSIAITDAVSAKLAIKAGGGNGSVDLGSLAVTGTLASASGVTTNLTGAFSATGGLGKIVLGSITGGLLLDSGGALPMVVKVVGAVSDSNITSAGTINSLFAGSWTDSNGSSSALSALSVNKFVIPGEMKADVTLVGALGIASGKFGTVTGGNWFLNGSAGKLSLGTTIAGWTSTFGGSVGSLSGVTITGNITANNINSIKAVSISGANITLVKTFDGINALGKLSAGSIVGSEIRSTDSIGSISTGSIDDSIISAGINLGDDSVNDLSDFVNAATIASFRSGTFNNTGVIAQNLGKVALGLTADAIPTRAFFGVAADKIASLSATVIDKRLALRLLDDPAAVPGLISAQGVTLANIQVLVL